MELITERLRLVASSLELAEALQHDVDRAGSLLEATLPEEWPDAELLDLLPIYERQLRADASTVGEGVWIAVELTRGVVVGSAGFTGPAKDGVVELGYGMHPAYRNVGYATEASRALVAWALHQPGIEEVFSQCERENQPSVRVLEKAGLVRTGERESMLLWSTRSTQPADSAASSMRASTAE